MPQHRRDEIFTEEMIDQSEVCRRIPGRYDEDYEVFKCPTCARIYLLDYEDWTIFIDPSDYTKVVADENFHCSQCGSSIPDDAITIGPKAEARFRPTVGEMLDSSWAWIMKAPQR